MIKDRVEAGKLLADKIHFIGNHDFLVLAIPRGGVIVGHEIAKKINCKLDIVISKKITPSDNPEFAIGAITHDGTLFQSNYWKNYANDPNLNEEISKKKLEVKRRLEESFVFFHFCHIVPDWLSCCKNADFSPRQNKLPEDI